MQTLQVDENLRYLRELLQKAEVPELDKEEAGHALDRISQLARKEKTPEVAGKIKEKLEVVKTVFDIAKDVGAAAAPYIALVAQMFS